MQSALPFSAGGAAKKPPARVATRAVGGVPQPRAAATPARLGRLDHRQLGLRGRADRLRLRSRRRLGRRPDRADPLAARSGGLAVRGDPRRPLPARARDARVRPAARGRARNDGGLRLHRSAGRHRLRPGRHGLRDQHGLPPGAVGAAALAGEDARGADRRQRELEHDREPRLLRRPRARRAPASGLERLGRFPRHRGAVPLVGADAVAAPPRGRAALERGAVAAVRRGDGRLPRDRRATRGCGSSWASSPRKRWSTAPSAC